VVAGRQRPFHQYPPRCTVHVKYSCRAPFKIRLQVQQFLNFTLVNKEHAISCHTRVSISEKIDCPTGAMTSLPPIATLPHLSDAELTSVLDVLFEPSPPLHALTLPLLRSETFPSWKPLIVAVHTQLHALAQSGRTADVDRLSQILCSHPRLGEKKVDSEQSRAEQAQLQAGGEEEKEQLAKLNEEYEAKFPGLRYVYVQIYIVISVALLIKHSS
jgi:2-oxo-4-hydroxy-4-carboxy--5-ureidoimidazoline (OHCU) decarboxylase